MRILYGVCGEGMGHAIRSSVVAEHLLKRGHELLFVTSGRAESYLGSRVDDAWKAPGGSAQHFAEVVKVPGLTLSKSGGEIQAIDTIVKNAIHQALGAVFESPTAGSAVLRFKPEAVISDFEPWSARYARLASLPLFAVDNIHFLSRCRQPPELMTPSVTLAAAVTSAMVPFADRYLVCSFAKAPPADKLTTVYPPVLRPEVLRSRTAARGQHLTVYLHDPSSHGATIRVLAASGLPCHIWGASPSRSQGNVTFLPFEDKAFIHDLSTSRAAVGSAGCQFTSEAAYLQRPMLALPIAGQGEQELNAAHLQRDGYGALATRLTPSDLAAFLERGPMFQQRLAGVGHDGNAGLFAALDRCLAGGAP